MKRNLILLIVVIIILSPFASPLPDGLERVAEDTGFFETADDSLIEIMPDYSLRVLGDGMVSTIASAVVGVLLVYGFLQLLRISKQVNRG